MADIRDIDRCIGDKSGEWFVRYGKDRRVITENPGPARERHGKCL